MIANILQVTDYVPGVVDIAPVNIIDASVAPSDETVLNVVTRERFWVGFKVKVPVKTIVPMAVSEVTEIALSTVAGVPKK